MGIHVIIASKYSTYYEKKMLQEYCNALHFGSRISVIFLVVVFFQYHE